MLYEIIDRIFSCWGNEVPTILITTTGYKISGEMFATTAKISQMNNDMFSECLSIKLGAVDYGV